ncbi:MAG: hypothetical protein IJD41_01060 [Alphaproteobacteria bacterium]|nr:hypothetical protein [Alphaproteobacteria bacterium]MBQ7127947.1 hypothetical protein [Alphaproteobacteria bacterium]
MTVFKTKIFTNENRGASVMEVLLALGIVALATPFVYSQISRSTQTVRDMAHAKQIMDVRDNVLNFVRMNQDKWPDIAQIRLDEDELRAISDMPVAGLIDKYSVRGATITDVYLAYEIGDDLMATARIASHIGSDAAVVSDDGVAYGASWAAAAPDFAPGDLVYRITRDVSGSDTSRYLHRATSGEDKLNVMFRDLNMGGYNVYNTASILADSVRSNNATAFFVNADDITAENVYFSSGANMDGGDVFINNMRVSGDITGFKNIYADKMNGTTYTTSGRIIADKATVANSINISRDLVLKSDSTKTISGFTGIATGTVLAPFLSTEEIIFYEDFGLTVSGELLMSTVAPLQIGRWVFPSTTPPRFSKFNISRTTNPSMPDVSEFDAIMKSGWMQTETIIPTE